MIMHVKAKNVHAVYNVATIWSIFHEFPAPMLDSITLQACKIGISNCLTFQDLCALCIKSVYLWNIPSRQLCR